MTAGATPARRARGTRAAATWLRADSRARKSVEPLGRKLQRVPQRARLPAPHPGEVLLLKFLRPRGITQVRLCKAMGISGPNLNRFIKGGSDMRASWAWEFAQALGTSPRYWMDIQVEYDLWQTRPARRIKRVKGATRPLQRTGHLRSK